jgi:hypothetical protein
MRAQSMLIPLAAAAVLASCGHHRSADQGPPKLTGVTAANESLRATALTTAEDSRDLHITVRLVNTGDQPVLFRNPESLRVSGFKAAADGREAVGCDAGRFESTKSAAARLKELPPGAESEVAMKWSFDPRLAHDSYPWTLTISNMYVGDQKLADVVLTYHPESK